VDTQGQPEKAKFTCVLGDSAWLDVRATRASHPVIEDELHVLVNCLRQLQQQPAFTPARKAGGKDKAAKVFVISPFRKVKNACIKRIKDAGLGQIECGTVHTFQGKEAEIVFLVLGTAPGQAGSGARAWASGKPNLLNVAITRAKHRLYVIGDARQWEELDNFADLRQALPLRAVANIPQNDVEKRMRPNAGPGRNVWDTGLL
jgi:superfamily I DNA/RNA helicase